MRDIIVYAFLLGCLCTCAQTAEAQPPTKPVITDVEFVGEFNYDECDFNTNNTFVITAVSSNFSGACLIRGHDDWPNHRGFTGTSTCVYDIPDSCFRGDTIIVTGRDVGGEIWDWGYTYYIRVGKGWVGINSDTIYTNDYISQEILDFIYGPSNIEAVETPVGKEGISIGPLTLRCPSPAQLCNLQGRTVEPVDTGGELLFRVPRHGVYLLRMRQAGRWVARKVAL